MLYRILVKMTTSNRNQDLTQQQLISKIKDELYLHGGRVKILDLAKELNVELNQLNLSVSEIVKGKEVQLVSNSLIANYNLEEIAHEINIKLQAQGHLSIDDLTLQFDLPADVLQHDILNKYLGKIISGRHDPSDLKVIYSKEFIIRNKAKIRGALMGLLKPTTVKNIMTHLNLTEGLFFYLFDQLNDTGSIIEHQTFKSWAQYEPLCFIKSRDDWFICWYKAQNYLEYHTLSFEDVLDEKGHLKKILPNENLIFLKGCAMNLEHKQKLETALYECIASKSYLNVQSCLNFKLYNEDIETFIKPLLKNYNNSTVLFHKTVFSIQFIETLEQACLPMVQKKAESVVMSGKYQQYLETQLFESEVQNTPVHHKTERCVEHREKSISAKEGGDSQDFDSDEFPCAETTSSLLKIINIEDVENTIKETLENENLNNFVTPIAEYILGHLNETALAIAKEFFDKLFQDAHNRKFTHYFAQNRINVLMNNIKLYEEGFKLFPIDQQPPFIRYLLKSLGTEVLSEFCKYVANECNLSVQGDMLSVEERNKIINDSSEECIKPLHALNSVLDEHSMEQFYQATDLCLSEYSMIFKKNDKTNRLLIHKHREKLISEIENCKEPALVLHLVVLVLFAVVTQNMLHASGRQVPLIIMFLKSQLKEEDFDKVQKYHETVVKYLTATDEEKLSLEEKLKEDLPSLRSIVTDFKK